MKQVLSIFTIAAVMVACNSNKDSKEAVAAENAKLQAYKDSVRLATDTAGLAQYRTWKMQNELSNPNEYDPNNAATATTTTSTTTKETNTEKPSHKTSKSYASTTKRSTTHKTSSGSGTYDEGNMSSSSGHTAETNTKKGWSKAAKGAAIGAGSGAVLGAIINKNNRAVGGVVGGVIGGGVGYGIGRSKDKKDGRY